MDSDVRRPVALTPPYVGHWNRDRGGAVWAQPLAASWDLCSIALMPDRSCDPRIEERRAGFADHTSWGCIALGSQPREIPFDPGTVIRVEHDSGHKFDRAYFRLL